MEGRRAVDLLISKRIWLDFLISRKREGGDIIGRAWQGRWSGTCEQILSHHNAKHSDTDVVSFYHHHYPHSVWWQYQWKLVSNIIFVLTIVPLILIVTSLSPFANIILPGDYDFCEAHLVVALSGLFPHGGIRGVRDMENYTLLWVDIRFLVISALHFSVITLWYNHMKCTARE